MNFHLEFRVVAMAVAIFAVIMNHTGAEGSDLAYIAQRGFLGVDTIVFLSGAGCYYSLCKCSNPYIFLKKRLLRLGPPYCVFNVIFISAFWKVFDVAETFLVIGMKLSGPNWYISGVWFFYLAILLFFPLVKCIQRFRVLVGYVIVLILFGYATSDNLTDRLIFGRLPVLFCGLYFGKCSSEMECLRPKVCASLFLMMTFGLHLMHMPLYDSMFYTYFPMRCMVASVCVTPAFCLIIFNVAYVLSFSRTGILVDLMMKIGDRSFECLLVHAGLLHYQITHTDIFVDRNVHGSRIHHFYINAGGSLVGGFILHFVSSRLSTVIAPYFDCGVRFLITEELSSFSRAQVPVGESVEL